MSAPAVSLNTATANAITAADNSQLALLLATSAVCLSLLTGLLLALATFAQAFLRSRGPFPISAVAESWRPRAARAWRPYCCAHALLALGTLAGAAAPLAPWGAGWVRSPAAAGADGAPYARGYYIILTGLWGSWRSCAAELAFEGPVCREGAAAAPRALLAACLALYAALLLLGAPAVALSALATIRVASVAGGAAPLGAGAARGGGCAPGAPVVAGVAWAAAAGAWAASAAAWAGRRALADFIVADAATAASALGSGAGAAGVGAGGALAALACALLTLGAALATWTGFARVGHLPGLGASRGSACCVEDDELLHETDPAAGAGAKRGDGGGAALRVVAAHDSSIYEMY